MAAPLLPILAGVLRGLVGRAVTAVGQSALRAGGRAVASWATRRGATAAAAEAGTAARTAATTATKQAATTAATPAPAPGFVRFFHGGQPYDGNHGRWVTPILDYAKGYAQKSKGAVVSYVDFPEGHPDLKKSFDDTGTSQKAPYVNFQTSEEDAKRLRPYREAPEAPAPRPGSSFTDVVKGYARQAQHHAGQFFSNVRRGWNGEPLQWQRYTPPSTPPGASPPASPPAPGGVAGKFSDIAGGYARQAAQWVKSQASQTTVGQMYQAVSDRWNYKRADLNEPPKYQPNVIPVYPNLTEDRLAQLSGQSADAFAEANAEAGAEQKRVEEEQRLNDVTKRLSGSFKSLLGTLIKINFAPYTFGAAVTNVVNPYIDAQISAYGRYNAAFAFMGKQREITDIQLSQRTAAATSGSARFVNEANLEGQRLLSEIHRDLKPLMNAAVGGAQHLANVALKVSQYMPLLASLRLLGRAIEKWLGKQDEVDPRTIAELVLDEALKAQQLNAHEKRPLKGVF